MGLSIISSNFRLRQKWQKKFFFCFILIKISQIFLGSKDGSKFLWLSWFPAIFLLLRFTAYVILMKFHEFNPSMKLQIFFKTLGGIITVHFSFLFFSFRSDQFKKTPWGRHNLKNGRRGLIFVLLLTFFDIFLSDFYLSFYFLLITDYGLITDNKLFTDKIKTPQSKYTVLHQKVVQNSAFWSIWAARTVLKKFTFLLK